MDLFITCGPGLEELLAQELGTLGYPQVVTGYRGASVSNVEFEAVYKINYCSRIASRVLILLSRFPCHDARSLYAGANKIDWERYVPEGKTIAIDANTNNPNIRNSLYGAQVVKDAICDQLKERFGRRPDVDVKNPQIQLNLFIDRERASISFDTSGTVLTKRSYRQETVEAPMQEALAAALLMLANYQGTEVLCDPCCGSGTLLIEAALMATKTPPGFLRTRWGFLNLPEHSNDHWLKVKIEADSRRVPLQPNTIFGADINKQAVHSSKVNLRAAGLHQVIEVTQSDIRDYTPPVPPSFIITNPPYGLRLNDVEHLKSLYRDIGDFMKNKTAKPARGFVFTGSLELSKEVGLSSLRRHVVEQSGIDARLLEYDLY